ncbi:MAG: hypothetical protein REI09_00665 [Candidatus Dactylopiibacterium sp.]|nr:hypothetical protein [Candidatus Dactylopiibacterium sp.]
MFPNRKHLVTLLIAALCGAGLAACGGGDDAGRQIPVGHTAGSVEPAPPAPSPAS